MMALIKARTRTVFYTENLLLLWCSLLSSWLLSCFLCSWLLGSLLCSRFLSSFLGSWFLCSLLNCLLSSLLCWLLSLWLLCLWFLVSLLLSRGKFEGASSFLTISSSSYNLLVSNHLFKSKTDTTSSLGSINLVVGNNILENSLAGGTLLVTKTLDGSSNHGGIGRVGSRSLGLGGLLDLRGSSSVRHCVVVVWW